MAQLQKTDGLGPIREQRLVDKRSLIFKMKKLNIESPLDFANSV